MDFRLIEIGERYTFHDEWSVLMMLLCCRWISADWSSNILHGPAGDTRQVIWDIPPRFRNHAIHEVPEIVNVLMDCDTVNLRQPKQNKTFELSNAHDTDEYNWHNVHFSKVFQPTWILATGKAVPKHLCRYWKGHKVQWGVKGAFEGGGYQRCFCGRLTKVYFLDNICRFSHDLENITYKYQKVGIIFGRLNASKAFKSSLSRPELSSIT